MKPGVKRSETPGSESPKLAEPTERAIGVAITTALMLLLSAAPRTSDISSRSVPGVPLRSTPGFTLSPRFAGSKSLLRSAGILHRPEQLIDGFSLLVVRLAQFFVIGDGGERCT
jgi:hypothetical protein